MAQIEQSRPDLTFIETKPRSDNRGLAVSVLEYVKANLNDHPIFFSDYPPELTRAGYKLTRVSGGPKGTMYQVQPAEAE